MKLHRFFAAAAIIAALPFSAAILPPAFAQTTDGVSTKTIITVLPKGSEQAPNITPQDLKVQVNGRSVQTDTVTPMRGDRAGLELVILIDSGARTSLGRQLGDISDFVKSLPPTTEVGIAYMANGRAQFDQPLTADKNRALQSLRLPAGPAGVSASPYFCLSDLAKNWPSHNTDNRREVIMITDGIDPYEVRFDPNNPYVNSAIKDAIRAGVVVDALYWHDQGLASRNGFTASGGQSLLTLTTQATGGRFYYQGLGNPVSFAPFLDELKKRMQNQYELGFTVPAKKKPDVQTLKVRLMMPGVKMDSPNLIYVPAVSTEQ